MFLQIPVAHLYNQALRHKELGRRISAPCRRDEHTNKAANKGTLVSRLFLNALYELGDVKVVNSVS